MIINVYRCDLCDNRFAIDGLSGDAKHVVCCPFDGNDGVSFVSEVQTDDLIFVDSYEGEDD